MTKIDDHLINLFALSEDPRVKNKRMEFHISRESAQVVARALREKAERENPRQLPPETLQQMDGSRCGRLMVPEMKAGC